MGFRVTPSILFRTSIADLNRQRSTLADTQERLASGREINRPSDDPAAAAQVVLLRAGLGAIEQFERNAENAGSRVEASEQSVANAFELLVRARQLAVAGANDSQDATGRAQMAIEVEGLFTALTSEANTTFSGGYLFGGLRGDTAPFELSGAFSLDPPTIQTANFVGDSTAIEIPIDDREVAPVAFDGRRIFLGDRDGDGATDAGREDVFDVMGRLYGALAIGDRDAVAGTLDAFDTALEQLAAERTVIGSVNTRLEAAERRLSERAVTFQARISTLEDADLATVVSELVQQESGLQASLSGVARLLQPTLIDFIG